LFIYLLTHLFIPLTWYVVAISMIVADDNFYSSIGTVGPLLTNKCMYVMFDSRMKTGKNLYIIL